LKTVAAFVVATLLFFVVDSSCVFAQTAQLHNTAGLAKFYQGKYEQAFAEFVTALRKDPSYASPHFNLGRLYEKQQRFEEALRQYQQCLQLDPRHEGARAAVTKLGYIVAPPREEPGPETVSEARRADLERQRKIVARLIVEGKLDRAEERLLILLRAHPRNGSFHNLLARVYERKGDYGRAIAELRKAQEHLPESSVVVYRLAANLYRIGAFDEAELQARHVLKMDAANYRAYHLLGLIYRSRDRLAEAHKFFNEAARLNPGDTRVQDELAKLNTQVGHYHFNSGLFYFNQRNWHKAKEEIGKAVQQGNLSAEQLAIAQQYLLIADFSSQRIDEELARLEKDRKNAERGFVQKRLTFNEVERSPNIWKRGAYIDFTGTIVGLLRSRKGILVTVDHGANSSRDWDVDDVSDFKRESEMKRWFLAQLPKRLPDDPRLNDRAIIRIEGKLSKPKYLRNPYNRLYSREPQPVVEVTYLRVESESDLSGPLKIDYLSYSAEQRDQKTQNTGSGWKKYRYR